MKNLTLSNIATAAGGTLVGPAHNADQEVTAVVTDSRKAGEGALFVAIRGDRVDGHKFVDQVMAAGAACVMVEEDLGAKPYPYIRVDSTLQAMKDVAEFYLHGLDIPVVGIAGSVGKTSTKEMTYSVLRQGYNVLKTEGNFNNELGVPITIFRLRDEQMAVLEMGISDFGEMHRLAQVVRPQTVIMTNIGYCHLENLIDLDGVLRAKSEIFDFLQPDAHIILNGDDAKLATVTDVRGIKPVYYGIDPRNDFWADNIKSLGLKGTSCRIHTPAGCFDVLVGLPGRHMVYNALAGTAAGLLYGLSLEQIKAGIESNGSLSGRFNIISTPRYTIIDDCYNASPVSMKASLEVLQDGANRRIAILGDMGELGADERKLHSQVGRFAAALNIDALYCAGDLSTEIAQAAVNGGFKGEVKHYDTRDALIAALPGLLHHGDTILVKASHFMQFPAIVSWLQDN